KRDGQGRALPYLDSIRLSIQQNRTMEMLRFPRCELHLINNDARDDFKSLSAGPPTSLSDSGPSLDTEFLSFNNATQAPLPDYKKAGVGSTACRPAMLSAINRDDLCRVVYHNHATPAVGPVSPANRHWYNAALKPVPSDKGAALRALAQDGFALKDGVLR